MTHPGVSLMHRLRFDPGGAAAHHPDRKEAS